MNRCSKIISLIICFVLLISQLGLEESLAIDTDSLQANSQAQPDQTEESQDQDDDSVATEANQEASEEANEEFSDEECNILAAEFDVTENTDNTSYDSIQDQTAPEENISEDTQEDSDSEFNAEEKTEVAPEETIDEVSEDTSDASSEETTEETTEETSNEASDENNEAGLPENTETDKKTEETSNEASNEVIDEASEEDSKDTADKASEATSEATSDEASEEPSKEDKKDLPSKDTEKDKKDEKDSDKETEEKTDVFNQEVTVGGIRIIVSIEEGTFPKGWKLEAAKAPETVHQQAEEAVDKVREDGRNVAEAYTFDIKILDKDGNEIQPAEGKKVEVTFVAPENADTNVETEVYHLTDSAKKKDEHKFSAEELTQVSSDNIPVEVKETIANPKEEITVETDGFSYYTVEFTYEDKQYVLQGGNEVTISEILKAVGLTGEVVKAETEDAPIEIREEEGVWYVGAVEAFTTTHIMKVTIKEIVYDINLGYQELERAVDIKVTDALESATKTITVTKVWENDDASVRPSDVEIHLEKTTSTLIPGPDFSLKMRSLSGYPVTNPRTDNTAITSFEEATPAQYDAVKDSLTSANEVQASGEKTYIWFDNGTIFIYSLADNVFLNANSNSMFSKMLNLNDISGVARFNTTYVTKMAFMFEDCVSLRNISPLANWDVGNVVTMRLMLGANVTDASHDHMNYTSLEALRNWNTQKLEDSGMMFKASQGITSIEPLSGWNVSNLRNVSQMFFRTYNISNATCLNSWNVVRVGGSYYNEGGSSTATGSFSQMFGRSGANKASTVPTFTYRAGKWNNSETQGTFTPSSSPASGSAATTTKTQDAVTEYVIGDGGTAWTKSGSTWTASFTVSNDNADWRAWEETGNGYLDDANGVSNAYMESSNGIDGYGSSSSDPVTGIRSSVTITNTRLTQTLTVAQEIIEDLESPATFNYTLYLWTGETEMEDPYDLTTVPTGVTRTAAGTYTFSLSISLAEPVVPEAGSSIEIGDIVKGVSYKIVQTPQEGWELLDSEHETGHLDSNRRAEFINHVHTAQTSSWDLMIENMVSGNQASRDKYFKIEVTLTDAGNNVTHRVFHMDDDPTVLSNAATLPAYIGETNPSTITTDATGSGTATFYLHNDQFIIIEDLPNGAKYTVTETYEDYSPSVLVHSANSDDTDYVSSSYSVSDTTTGISDDIIIRFTNTKHGVIPSGESISNIGLLLAAIGLLAMGLKKKFGGVNHE